MFGTNKQDAAIIWHCHQPQTVNLIAKVSLYLKSVNQA